MLSKQPKADVKKPNKPTRQSKKCWIKRFFVFICVVLLCVFALAYWLISSDKGSQYLLSSIEKINPKASFDYKAGNFLEGIQFRNVTVPIDKNNTLYLDKADIKLGWKSLIYDNNIHLRDLSVNEIKFVDTNAPTGKPFSYKPINLPVSLVLDNVRVKRFSLLKKNRNPSHFDNITANRLLWIGDKLIIKQGALDLERKDAQFKDINGNIVFTKKYPVNATAQIVVPMIKKYQFSPFNARLTGDLSDVHGVITGNWDKEEVTAVAHLYPFEKRFPFKAVVGLQDFKLPLAKTQDLQFSDGALAVNGTLDNIVLAIDSHIKGKYVPKGHYQSVALFPLKQFVADKLAQQSLTKKIAHPIYRHMQIKSLNAQTEQGSFAASGGINWQNGIHLALQGDSQNVGLNKYIPNSAHPYAPTALNGHFQIEYNQFSDKRKKPNQKKWLTIDFNDSNGDKIKSKLSFLGDKKQSIDVTAQVLNKSNDNLPFGTYKTHLTTETLKKNVRKIRFKQFAYQGAAGNAVIDGALLLNNNRVHWAGQAQRLKLDFNHIKQLKQLPVKSLNGEMDFSANYQANQSKNNELTISSQNVNLDIGVPVHNQRVRANKQAQIYRQISLTGVAGVHLGIQSSHHKKSQTSSITNLLAKFDGNIATKGMPNGKTTLEIAGVSNQFAIKKLHHSGDAGTINAIGSLDLRDGVQWQLSSDLQQFNPVKFFPTVTGDLSGSVITKGKWSAQTKWVAIDKLDVNGMVNEYPFTSKGSLNININTPKKIINIKDVQQSIKTLNANGLEIDWNQNRVFVDGNDNVINAQINANNLGQFHSQLSGNATGLIKITGIQQTKPTIDLDIDLDGLKVNKNTIKSAKLIGNINQFAEADSTLTIDAKGVRINQSKIVLDKINAVAKGTKQQLVAKVTAVNELGHVTTHLRGGITASNVWQGQLYDSEIASKKVTLQQQNQANLSVNTQNYSLMLSQHCWLPKENTLAKLCFNQDVQINQQGGLLDVSFNQIDSGFIDLIKPQSFKWNGALKGDVKLNWAKNRNPDLYAYIATSHKGNITFTPKDPQDEKIGFDYDNVSLKIATKEKGVGVRLDVKTPLSGTGYLDVVIDPKSPNKDINGSLVFDAIQLKVLQGLLPQAREITGELSIAGGMSGPLKSPEFYGNMNLKNSSISMINVPFYIKNANINSAIRGKTASIKGEFATGKGKGFLTGDATWADAVSANIKLTGQHLELRKPPTIYAELNPNMDIKIGVTDKVLSVNGNLNIAKARITSNIPGENVIAKSDDVIVVRTGDDKKENNVKKRPKSWNINTNLKVKLAPDDVNFVGFGAKVPLTGGVNFIKRGKSPLQGFGQIEIAKRVPIQVYGQNLELTEGKVRFDGSIKTPTLKINTQKKIESSVVGVRVTGTPLKPRIHIFNDAGLDEQQAVNALVTGRLNSNAPSASIAGFENNVNNTLTAAGLSLGLQQTHQLTNKIGQNFGLSGLTVDATGSNDDAKVNITGYITPDLYLRYGVGVFTTINALSLRYQVNKNVYLEATSALEKAIDIFYNWRF